MKGSVAESDGQGETVPGTSKESKREQLEEQLAVQAGRKGSAAAVHCKKEVAAPACFWVLQSQAEGGAMEVSEITHEEVASLLLRRRSSQRLFTLTLETWRQVHNPSMNAHCLELIETLLLLCLAQIEVKLPSSWLESIEVKLPSLCLEPVRVRLPSSCFEPIKTKLPSSCLESGESWLLLVVALTLLIVYSPCWHCSPHHALGAEEVEACLVPIALAVSSQSFWRGRL